MDSRHRLAAPAPRPLLAVKKHGAALSVCPLMKADICAYASQVLRFPGGKPCPDYF